MIDKVISIMIGAFLNVFISLYICSKILRCKLNSKLMSNILAILLISILIGLSYLITESFIKIIIVFWLLTFLYVKIYSIGFSKGIILSFIVLSISLFVEVFYAIILVTFFKTNLEFIRVKIFGSLISNVAIIIIQGILINIKSIKRFLENLIKIIENQKNKEIALFSITTLITIGMLLYYIYFEKNIMIGFIFSLVFIGMYVFLTLNLFKEKGEIYKLQLEYEMILSSLSEYEKLYSYQRMINHEFKNDLMVIRGMANQKNKKLLTYVDEIVDFKNTKTEKWLDELKKIPEGGLLGILYYKLLIMEQEKINITFKIGRKFAVKDYKLIDESLKNKLCKLLGIYLDNSIQAVKNIPDKFVSIEINEEDGMFVFIIMNNFKDTINLDKIYDKGYSTNGTGRGYGLAIAKEIFGNDNRIINNTAINGNVFSQKIKIKM